MCDPLILFGVRVTIAFVGVVVGIVAGVVFGVTFHNVHAAGWAAASSLFALVALVVIILVYMKKLNDWSLTLFALVGATGIIIGSTAFVLYIVLGIYEDKNREKDKPLPESYFIVPVWAFMVIKHSTVLAWVTSYELVKMFRHQQNYQQIPVAAE